MAELAGAAVGAVPKFPVQYQSTAHAGADRNVEHVPSALADSVLALGERSGVGVIFQEGGQTDGLGHAIHQRNFPPARQVGRFMNHAGPPIERSGRADPHGREFRDVHGRAG